MRTVGKMAFVLCTALAAAAGIRAAQPPGDGESTARAIPVTAVAATSRTLENWEPSVGQLESVTAPVIGAEVGGRIIGVSADVGQEVETGQELAWIDAEDFRLESELAEADIERLQALVKDQVLQVKRLQQLVKKRSASQSALDGEEAQLGALQAQLRAARVRLQQARLKFDRATIVSPVDGRVDERHISVGDYVKVGAPLFKITTLDHLRVRLPYPESLGAVLRTGLPVRLNTAMAPGLQVSGKITGIRPEITPSNRAIIVIIDLDNPGDWEPGASVSGTVRVALHDDAVVVPEAGVVRRPAGTVVYVLDGDQVRQRMVRTGLRREGLVEILSGLEAGERITVDGAGFLSDGASVEVKGP